MFYIGIFYLMYLKVWLKPGWSFLTSLHGWPWSSLSVLAGILGTSLFVSSNSALGRGSNKVSISWNINVPPLDFMDVDLGGLGFSRIGLSFGTFFGVCFHL